MQEGTAATSAPATNPAPMASTDKPKSWKELDANKDGKLSKDEVAGDATWTADFDTADANKDGFLSKSEFKKHEADLKKVASNDSRK
jgi:Ca2+-binding EF-hand superfamily protein